MNRSHHRFQSWKKSPRSRIIAIGLLCLGTTAIISQARAGGILQQILDTITGASNRAAAARDRAIEARNNAADARDRANEMRDNLRNGLAHLTDQIRDSIDEAVEDMQRRIMEKLEGRADFVADGGCSVDVCEPFRQNLLATLQGSEDLINILYEIAGMQDMHADFQRLIRLIDLLPGRVLFPIYRVLVEQSNVFEGGLLEVLPQALQHLQLLRDAMEQLRSGTPEGETRLDSELANCQWWDDNLENLRAANVGATSAAALFKVLGGLLNAAGTTKISADGGASVVNGELTTNSLGAVGEIWTAYADAVFMCANFITNKTRYCTKIVAADDVRQSMRDSRDELAGTQDAIEANNDAILAGQQAIMQALADFQCVDFGADLDHDNDVDLEDYALFQEAFTGP